MGDIAQAYGQWLLRSEGGLSDETWLSYGWPAPSGDLWVGSYLDDILVVFVEAASAAARGVLPADAPDADVLCAGFAAPTGVQARCCTRRSGSRRHGRASSGALSSTKTT